MTLQPDHEAMYVTTAWWRARPADEWDIASGMTGYQPEPSVKRFAGLEDAETYGAQMGCMRGVLRVEVRSPDGQLQALWDKESRVVTKRRMFLDERGRMIYDVEHKNNHWQRLGEESKALNRRINADITAARDALYAELGGPPTSMQVVDRMRRDRVRQ